MKTLAVVAKTPRDFMKTLTVFTKAPRDFIKTTAVLTKTLRDFMETLGVFTKTLRKDHSIEHKITAQSPTTKAPSPIPTPFTT